jgi:thiosulfate/3-mercaptopyruvate sulfurtransferase
MKNLVTSKWLAENLNREDIVIIDCRFELGDPAYGRSLYEKSHIKNAVFVDLEKDLTGKVMKHGGRHPLPDMNEFKKTMETLGVGDSSKVIVYDDGDLAGASRLWWMLKYIGKDHVYVLEGGLNDWVAMGFEGSNNVPDNIIAGNLTLNIASEMVCDVNTVRASLHKDDTIIVDSRARERYLGLVEPIDNKAGHIPGSRNYFWQEIFNGEKLKDSEELRDLFSSLMNYEKIIIHCGSGITACPNILAMDEIGLKPVHYAGAWSDWVSYEENPVVIEE